MKTVNGYGLRVFIFLVYLIHDADSSNTTTDATNSTSVTTTTTKTYVTSVTISTTVNTTLAATTLELTNNVTPMAVGIAIGVGVVVIAILITAVTFAKLKQKKIHPSETETIFSDTISESDFESRPTTASHIFIDHTDDVPSRPVTMTPFELRKLFVETFPYEKWKPGYDGSLKPRMPLRFVHPSRYSRTKSEELEFRKKIYQFEMTENLTISRPPSSTRMYTRSRAFSTHTLDPVPERAYPNGGVIQTESGELFHSATNSNDNSTGLNSRDLNKNAATLNITGNSHTDEHAHNGTVNNVSDSNVKRSNNITKERKKSQNEISCGNTDYNKAEQEENILHKELNGEYLDIEQYDDIMTTEL